MKKVILPFILLSNSFFSQFITIDDVLNQPTVVEQELISCDFEQVCTSVNIVQSWGNIWQIGTPSKTLFDSSFSQNLAIVTDTVNSYNVNSFSSFDVSFNYNVSHGVLLEFMHKIDSDTLGDGGYIDLSYDNGATWTNIINEAENNNFLTLLSDNLYTTTDSLSNGGIGFSGAIHAWTKVRVYLDWQFPINGLMFRFNFKSDIHMNGVKEGWMIDDIKVFDIANSISVKENEVTNYKIYPNPIQDNLTIEIPEEIDFQNPVNFRLVDLAGRVVLAKQLLNNRESLSTQQLADGVYTAIIFQNETSIYTKKIIKL